MSKSDDDVSERLDTNLIAKVCQGKGSFQEGAKVEAYCHELEAEVEEWGTKETEQRVRATRAITDIARKDELLERARGMLGHWTGGYARVVAPLCDDIEAELKGEKPAPPPDPDWPSFCPWCGLPVGAVTVHDRDGHKRFEGICMQGGCGWAVEYNNCSNDGRFPFWVEDSDKDQP